MWQTEKIELAQQALEAASDMLDIYECEFEVYDVHEGPRYQYPQLEFSFFTPNKRERLTCIMSIGTGSVAEERKRATVAVMNLMEKRGRKCAQ